MSDSILMHRQTIEATITVLVLRAGFGPAHFTEVEPLIAELSQACVETADVWITVDPLRMQRIQEGIRYSSARWQWLRDLYRRAVEDKKAGRC